MNEKGLGARLQKARQAGGLTQQQLCQTANLSFSTLTKIERGAIKAPSIFTIQAIAAALNVGLDELMGVPSPSLAASRALRKTKSGVSFIYFDVNGCLVHFFQRAFARAAEDTGVSADNIQSAYWHFTDDVCRGTMSLADFNAKTAERLGVPTIDWQQYYLDAIEPIQEMHDMLLWASQHYRVGLLSNIMPGLLTVMRKNGSVPDLPYDVIIDSSEVGTIKPESRIYEIAAERAGVPPSEILLVDDSPANLMAAERLGWHVLWFDDARPASAAGHVRETLEPATL